MNKFKIWLPFVFASLLAIGIFIGIKLNQPFVSHSDLFSFRSTQFNKLNQVIDYIKQEYVDTVNQKQLVESAIDDMLHQLDPHSAYIPAEDLQAMNEPLQGSFEGIGIEFHVQNDTIMVVTAISGGPSDQLGIRSGDRITRVEGKNVAGIHISNLQVTQLLRGPSGTKVKVTVKRQGLDKTIDYNITRGKIPLYSIDASYMIDNRTGYVKVSHFGEHTYEEYLEAFKKLNASGMQNLVLDLRGNPGGYLKTAIQIADEFLPEGKLIVYTEGHSKARETYTASSKGSFEKGKLIVLIDEGSASASEIVAGALQDWDRATIVGRRSFGKGLVQEQSEFPDGSAIRLTVARYYTPTGRSIQKPYGEGYESYEKEIYERIKRGELSYTDSIHFADSLKYTTPGGHSVFGGGGIMPDVFVPIDSDGVSPFFSEATGKGLIIEYAYKLLDDQRGMIAKSYPTLNAYLSNYAVSDNDYQKFVDFAAKSGVNRNEEGVVVSAPLIKLQLKALMARQVWKNEGFYSVIQQRDPAIKKVTDLIRNNQVAEISSSGKMPVSQRR